MSNYSIKADLMKIKGAFVANIQGRTARKRCVCIPIEGSGLFLGKQGCYLNMTAIEMQNPKFEDTHCVKVQFDRDVYEKMSDEERRAQPIIGGLHAIERRQEQMSVAAVARCDDDDMPF